MKISNYDINKIRLFNILIIVEVNLQLFCIFVPTDVNVKGVGQNIIIALRWFGGLTAFTAGHYIKEKILSM